MKILPYDRNHKRDQFSCGKNSLDNYILRNVTKDVKAGTSTCFVAIDDQMRVIAYYTLAADHVPLEEAPDSIKRNIKYPYIPVILLGRLAVDQKMQGHGLGKLLLIDALLRCMQVAHDYIGSVAVVVYPIDEEAEGFYTRYGFTKLPDSGRMFMTIRKIKEAFEETK